jgi:hypothetical protein
VFTVGKNLPREGWGKAEVEEDSSSERVLGRIFTGIVFLRSVGVREREQMNETEKLR